ncbi:MAG: hypothetical protein KF782_03345 [Labilithrix sp.]|nr:hypothetical protein [Labilithrix sp.]
MGTSRGLNGPGPGTSLGIGAPGSPSRDDSRAPLTFIHATGPTTAASRAHPESARCSAAAFASPRRSASASRAFATSDGTKGPPASFAIFASRSSIVPPLFRSEDGSTRSASELDDVASEKAVKSWCTSASSEAIAIVTLDGLSGDAAAAASAFV